MGSEVSRIHPASPEVTRHRDDEPQPSAPTEQREEAADFWSLLQGDCVRDVSAFRGATPTEYEAVLRGLAQPDVSDATYQALLELWDELNRR